MHEIRKKLQKYLIIIASITLFAFLCGYYANKDAQIMAETMEEEQQQSFFEDVTLSGNANSLQRIRLYKNDDGVYNVYMPSEMRTNVNVYFSKFQELQIGNVVYQNGEPLTDIYNGSDYMLCAKDQDGKLLEEAVLKFYFTVEVPSVYIESKSGSLEVVNSDKSVKEEANYAAISATGENDTSGQCEIKARGNTSFAAEQKSYSINLDSAEGLFGMEPCSEWVLVANYGNSIQQLKNKIVYDIAGMMDMPYTPESTYVNLYIDNQYNGLYLLAQKVSADGGSVKIEQADIRSGISGPYLLEFDARYKEESIWIKTGEKSVVVKYPKTVREEAYTYISEYMRQVETAIYSENEKVALKDIHLDSWIEMYLIQEFFAQWDVEFASFYMYKYAGDPRLYAGPVWDFDLSYGKMFPGYYPQTTIKTQWLKDCKDGWLGKLAEYPKFYNAMTEQYLNKMEPMISEYLENHFDELVGRLVSASYMNARRWNRGEPDIRVDAEDIRSWIVSRQDFLKDYYTNPETYHQVLFQFGWGCMSYYVKDQEILGMLPMKEYGESDYLEDKDYGYGTIIGWEDKNGNLITDETLITEDVVCYAIYQ